MHYESIDDVKSEGNLADLGSAGKWFLATDTVLEWLKRCILVALVAISITTIIPSITVYKAKRKAVGSAVVKNDLRPTKKISVDAGEWKKVRREDLKSFDLVPMLKWRAPGYPESLIVSDDTVIASDVTEIEFCSQVAKFAITVWVSREP